ncbi:MAG: patatin family protein [Bacteroidaceae bacterium]|nr:patatin family protein [Bacteroidaceae bacterium]
MKTGLVLEGGAMRGLFSAGVFDVLMENGITFDGLVGVSAGACFGCNIKSRQIGRALRYNMAFAKDWRYCSVRSLVSTGNLFNAEFAYHRVPSEFDLFDNETFESNPMEYHLVTTDVFTGKAIYKKIDRGGDYLYEWIRASSAMPAVSKVVEIDGLKMLDGGISDSIPLRYFQEQGYQRNLVILTQPAGFEKKPMQMMWLFRLMLRKYPVLADALADRHIMYNEQLHYLETEKAKGDTYVICPKEPLKIGRISHDAKAMKETYEEGRAMAINQLQAIKDFINK